MERLLGLETEHGFSVPAGKGRDRGVLLERFMAQAPLFTAELWGEVGRRSAAAGPEMSELVDAARAADGGKFVRPRLVATAFFGLGGDDEVLLRRVAGAQQLLHLGLCMHDDVIDGDRVRHGRPNVIGLGDAIA